MVKYMGLRAVKGFNPDFINIYDNDILLEHYIHRERATWLDSNRKYSYILIDKCNNYKEIGEPCKTIKGALKNFLSHKQRE